MSKDIEQIRYPGKLLRVLGFFHKPLDLDEPLNQSELKVYWENTSQIVKFEQSL